MKKLILPLVAVAIFAGCEKQPAYQEPTRQCLISVTEMAKLSREERAVKDPIIRKSYEKPLCKLVENVIQSCAKNTKYYLGVKEIYDACIINGFIEMK